MEAPLDWGEKQLLEAEGAKFYSDGGLGIGSKQEDNFLMKI